MKELIVTYGNSVWAPSWKFYISDSVTNFGSFADQIWGGMRHLVSQAWQSKRWEARYIDGERIAHGAMSGSFGLAGGDIEPARYCILLSLESEADVNRPSLKYVHGFTEGFKTNGLPNSILSDAVNDAAVQLVTIGVLDSDGEPLTGMSFRSFTSRRKVAREPAVG